MTYRKYKLIDDSLAFMKTAETGIDRYAIIFATIELCPFLQQGAVLPEMPIAKDPKGGVSQ